MTLGENFERIPYATGALERAAVGVRIPEIFADVTLFDAFAQNEFDITFDSGAVVDSANDLGFKNHIRVVLIGADPANFDKPVYFPNTRDVYSRDTVFVAIETDPEDIERATYETNVRVFTALLASNLLDQPKSAMEEMDALCRGIRRKSLKKKIGGGALTATGIAVKGAAMTGHAILPAAIGLAFNAAGFVFSTWGRRTAKKLEKLHPFSEHFETHVIDKMVQMATVLAKEYTIIDYSMDQPEDGIELER